MIDLNNPDKAGPYDPAACWKRALIKYLAKLFNITTFIETGTCYGDTVDDVKDDFSDIWSVELDEGLYEHSTKRFYHSYPKVHIIHGSSGEELEYIIKHTDGPRLFWLDAHATGDIPGNGSQVNKELAAVWFHCHDSLVLIDDVKPVGKSYTAADTPIEIHQGWAAKFLHGVLILHDGRYLIPEVFDVPTA